MFCGKISTYVKVSSVVAASSNLRLNINAKIIPKKIKVASPRKQLTIQALNKSRSYYKINSVCAPIIQTDIRMAHTDIKVPDFTEYRRESTKMPGQSSRQSQDNRAISSYLIALVGGMGFAYSTKVIAHVFLKSMLPSADVLAVSQAEFSLADIPEGKNVTVKWRGKPIFIRHRTPEDIARERETPLSILRDPETDQQRAIKPEFLVVIGVCTHLGCVPMAGLGDFPGGYYCPCHGSHFDGAGRVRKGPAPRNLEIPPYTYIDDTTILVG